MRFRLGVAAEAVHGPIAYDFLPSTHLDHRTRLTYVQIEELPIAGRGIPSGRAFDHRLSIPIDPILGRGKEIGILMGGQ